MAAQRNVFALVNAGIALLIATLLVIGRPLPFYALPIVLAIATYVFSKRLRKGTEASITRHEYAISAPRPGTGKVEELSAKLGAHGYEPTVVTLDPVGQPGPPPANQAPLAGAQLKMVDRRAAAELGLITVRLRIDDSGALVGFVEADDTGPGFYDEMAQFLILDLGQLVPELSYVKMGKTPERRPAGSLQGELPARPYGLGLL